MNEAALLSKLSNNLFKPVQNIAGCTSVTEPESIPHAMLPADLQIDKPRFWGHYGHNLVTQITAQAGHIQGLSQPDEQGYWELMPNGTYTFVEYLIGNNSEPYIHTSVELMGPTWAARNDDPLNPPQGVEKIIEKVGQGWNQAVEFVARNKKVTALLALAGMVLLTLGGCAPTPEDGGRDIDIGLGDDDNSDDTIQKKGIGSDFGPPKQSPTPVCTSTYTPEKPTATPTIRQIPTSEIGVATETIMPGYIEQVYDGACQVIRTDTVVEATKICTGVMNKMIDRYADAYGEEPVPFGECTVDESLGPSCKIVRGPGGAFEMSCGKQAYLGGMTEARIAHEAQHVVVYSLRNAHLLEELRAEIAAHFLYPGSITTPYGSVPVCPAGDYVFMDVLGRSWTGATLVESMRNYGITDEQIIMLIKTGNIYETRNKEGKNISDYFAQQGLIGNLGGMFTGPATVWNKLVMEEIKGGLPSFASYP